MEKESIGKLVKRLKEIKPEKWEVDYEPSVIGVTPSGYKTLIEPHLEVRLFRVFKSYYKDEITYTYSCKITDSENGFSDVVDGGSQIGVTGRLHSLAIEGLETLFNYVAKEKQAFMENEFEKKREALYQKLDKALGD